MPTPPLNSVLRNPVVDFVDVDGLSVHFEDRIDVVEIGVFRTPETRFLQRPGGGQNGLFAIDHVDGVAFEFGANLAALIDDHRRQRHGRAIAGSIPHLRLDRHVGASCRAMLKFAA